eukprot:scaffold3381_cov144-Skeletonema_menzelii.AAC.2
MKNTGLFTATVVAAIISLPFQSVSAFFPTGVAHQAHHIRSECSKPITAHRHCDRRVPSSSCRIQEEQKRSSSTLYAFDSNEDDNEIISSQTPLCDLQTFLRLCNLVQSGGEAKNVIQNSQCLLNDVVETRRSKKLFLGDTVTFGDVTNLDVAAEVKKKGYVYKPKVKKVKPLPRVDEDGNLEFGGRYRSEEWRAERKLKKEERKRRNQGSK